MQVNEENQKDGGKLRSEEERKGHTGSYDFNKLQQQKQSPTRTKKVPGAAPRSTDYGSEQTSPCRQRGPCEGRQGRVHSRHENAPRRGPERKLTGSWKSLRRGKATGEGESPELGAQRPPMIWP